MRLRARRRGFSMVELMIALLLSSIVLIAVYFVFISNTEQYYRQEQIVQMQEGMRFALDHIKSDLRNSGRLTVVNGTPVNTDPGFCRPQAGLRAMELFGNEGPGSRADFPAIVDQFNNEIAPDRLRLLVDGSGATPLVTQRLAGRVVTIQAGDRQPTRAGRALVDDAAEARFERMFQTGHFLYIEALDEKLADLVPIASVNYRADGPEVVLARRPCVPAAACGNRCNVNPVQLVEYALVADANNPTRSDLERRVISSLNDRVIDGSRLIIAEYTIDLQVWGTYDTRANSAAPPRITADPDPTDDIGNWPGANDEEDVLNSRPERVRALNVLLATRTPRADESFTVSVPVEVASDRTWFKLDALRESGQARVATLLSEVETPNIYRGVQ